MTTTLRRLMLICLSFAVAALIAACGGSSSTTSTVGTDPGSASPTTASAATTTSTTASLASKSPTEILAATKAAVSGLNAVHITGTINKSSETIKLDLELVGSAKGKGTMAVNGLGFKVVNLGNTFYMQPSNAFWTHYASSAAAKLLDGKWIKAPSSGQFGAFKKLLNVQTIFKSIFGNKLKLSATGQSTINGQQVVGIHDSLHGGTLYVASSGKPYPIEIVHTGKPSGKVSFSGFNQPVTISAPKGAVSLAKLQASASSSAS